jgi:hypothetical protein
LLPRYAGDTTGSKNFVRPREQYVEGSNLASPTPENVEIPTILKLQFASAGYMRALCVRKWFFSLFCGEYYFAAQGSSIRKILCVYHGRVILSHAVFV